MQKCGLLLYKKSTTGKEKWNEGAPVRGGVFYVAGKDLGCGGELSGDTCPREIWGFHQGLGVLFYIKAILYSPHTLKRVNDYWWIALRLIANLLPHQPCVHNIDGTEVPQVCFCWRASLSFQHHWCNAARSTCCCRGTVIRLWPHCIHLTSITVYCKVKQC